MENTNDKNWEEKIKKLLTAIEKSDTKTLKKLRSFIQNGRKYQKP